MLTTTTRQKLENILNRVANGEKVSLKERIYLNNYADKDQTISNWLKKARRLQQNPQDNNEIDNLLNGLDLGSSDPNSTYKPDEDDLGDWFRGAPSWLVRS